MKTILAAVCAAVLLSGLLSACSPLSVLNATTSADGLRQVEGVAYGDGPRRKLDLYVPETAAAARRPVVVFFYGGAWQTGSRADYRFAGRALASEGFVVVVPDYRVHPEVGYPAFLEDSAAAVRWARDHAAEYGGDPDQLFVMGHSSGAYNAAMLALDGRWLNAVGLDPKRDLRGWIGLSGPYDFAPIVDPVVQTIFGPRSRWPSTQPIAYASAGAPPALLLTGDDDARVQAANSQRLAARLEAVNVPVQLTLYPGVGHARTVVALASGFRSGTPVLQTTADFIRGRSPATQTMSLPQ